MAANDFNGDGRSDILWRSQDGVVSNWLGTASGGFVGNNANAWTPADLSWRTQPGIYDPVGLGAWDY